jgi:hypothetical protein
MNRPRQGGPPREAGRHYEPPEKAIAQFHPLDYKIESGLAPTKRDTARNRFLAKQQGWTDEKFDEWCSREEEL